MKQLICTPIARISLMLNRQHLAPCHRSERNTRAVFSPNMRAGGRMATMWLQGQQGSTRRATPPGRCDDRHRARARRWPPMLMRRDAPLATAAGTARHACQCQRRTWCQSTCTHLRCLRTGTNCHDDEIANTQDNRIVAYRIAETPAQRDIQLIRSR
jgi:hypothetical protein